MYKLISNIFITVAIGLLVITITKPDLADKVLGTFIQTATTVPLSVTPAGKSETFVRSPITSYLHTIKPTTSGTVKKSGGEIGANLPDNDIATPSTNNIIDATNRERIKAGLLPLILNTKLVSSAEVKARDMLTKQYFEHISPTGQSVSDLGTKAGYDYIIMGENLALGDFIDGADVVEAWMNSPGHRANILSDKYQEIGVFAIKGMYQGREAWFAVQHFGTARSACPAISTTLKVSIDAINSDLKSRQAAITIEKEILEGPDRPRGEEYKTRVAAFNGMVAEYNTALVISQEKIKQYNAQVAAFNACLVQYQK